MLFGMGLFEVLLTLAAVAVPLIAVWRIVSKAGYSGAWSLLLLVPLVNLVALYVFAFSEWPVRRQAAERQAS